MMLDPSPKNRWDFRIVLACLLILAGALGWAVDTPAQDSATDRAALVALYNATGGPNWTNNTNWLSDEPLSEWHGVTVTNGRVTRLSLSNNQLTGSIPAQLGDLSGLDHLDLQSNDLTGTIPSEPGNRSRGLLRRGFHSFNTFLLPARFSASRVGPKLNAPPFSIAPEMVRLGDCYTLQVKNGAGITLDLRYRHNQGPVQTLQGWPTLDGAGTSRVCTSPGTPSGRYEFTGYKNTLSRDWISISESLEIVPARSRPEG